MKTFFGLNRKFSSGSFKLRFDYCIEEIQSTMLLNSPEATPVGYLEKFTYEKIADGPMEDLLANNLGWLVFSSRVAEMLAACNNPGDIELLCLPQAALNIDSRLREYRALGIKKRVSCVNYNDSDILWSNSGKQIISFRKCFLNEKSVPENLDVFLMAEYPVMPVLSAKLAYDISLLHPTGFVYEKIIAS